MSGTTARRRALALRARRHGARYELRIIDEAKRAGLPVALAFALIEHESGFRNVFGHDPVRNPVKSPPGGTLAVTRGRYEDYLRHRRAGQGMQGVGPAQLTWWEFQDAADRLGGCWKVTPNLRVAFTRLAELIREHGNVRGIALYNGQGDAADAYSRAVRDGWTRWRKRLYP